MPEVHVLPDAEGLVSAAASFVARQAEASIRARERFALALSGGSTPRRLYEALATQPYATRMEWDRWHVFWGDERCVPPDHPDSNYRMAREALLDHVPIPAANAHRIRGEAHPNEAAREYEELLHRTLGTVGPTLDVVLLGLGEDGHTASLFPGSNAVHERQRLVVAAWVAHLQSHRITVTLPLINQARAVVFIVQGGSKAGMVRQAVEGNTKGKRIPAALAVPVSGELHWFLDGDAAGLLEQPA